MSTTAASRFEAGDSRRMRRRDWSGPGALSLLLVLASTLQPTWAAQQRQQQQQPEAARPPATEPPASINLIPVDQPVMSQQLAPAGKLELDFSEPADQQQASGQQAASSAFAPGAPESPPPSAGSEPTEADSSSSSSSNEDEMAPNKKGLSETSLLQVAIAAGEQKFPERRFGKLFKKHQHFGQPAMSATYLAPYMSDCERCLASMGGGGPQNADLQQQQQLEPAALPVAPPPPAAIPLPVLLPSLQLPSYNNGGNQASFGAPLKSKLFMKFPFFMKPPMSFGGGSGGGGSGDAAPSSYGPHSAETMPAYWPQYQPTRPPQLAPTNALFIRPASAYNCIQATPPLIAAASSGSPEMAQLTGGGVKSQLASQAAGSKQQYSLGNTAVQQSTYPSSSY